MGETGLEAHAVFLVGGIGACPVVGGAGSCPSGEQGVFTGDCGLRITLDSLFADGWSVFPLC